MPWISHSVCLLCEPATVELQTIVPGLCATRSRLLPDKCLRNKLKNPGGSRGCGGGDGGGGGGGRGGGGGGQWGRRVVAAAGGGGGECHTRRSLSNRWMFAFFSFWKRSGCVLFEIALYHARKALSCCRIRNVWVAVVVAVVAAAAAVAVVGIIARAIQFLVSSPTVSAIHHQHSAY